MGFTPKPVADMSKDEILERINLLSEHEPPEKESRAALGEKIKLFPLSALVDRVISIQASLKSKTDAEMHRYKTPRQRGSDLPF